MFAVPALPTVGPLSVTLEVMADNFQPAATTAPLYVWGLFFPTADPVVFNPSTQTQDGQLLRMAYYVMTSDKWPARLCFSVGRPGVKKVHQVCILFCSVLLYYYILFILFYLLYYLFWALQVM